MYRTFFLPRWRSGDYFFAICLNDLSSSSAPSEPAGLFSRPGEKGERLEQEANNERTNEHGGGGRRGSNKKRLLARSAAVRLPSPHAKYSTLKIALNIDEQAFLCCFEILSFCSKTLISITPKLRHASQCPRSRRSRAEKRQHGQMRKKVAPAKDCALARSHAHVHCKNGQVSMTVTDRTSFGFLRRAAVLSSFSSPPRLLLVSIRKKASRANIAEREEGKLKAGLPALTNFRDLPLSLARNWPPRRMRNLVAFHYASVVSVI